MEYFYLIYEVINLYSYFYIILLNIIFMIIITLIIAVLTLIERKVLSLLQRRVGPNFVGYRGRLQYISDALKLFLKDTSLIQNINNLWIIYIPSLAGLISYMLWINSIWGPNISMYEIEYNFIYFSISSMLFNFMIILLGYFSKNKYSFLAAIRSIIVSLNLELLLNIWLLTLSFIGESFSLFYILLYQKHIWLVFFFCIPNGIILITYLCEINRAPFDLVEAETELVCGYSTEIGGFYFGLYYLGEYLHLFFFSLNSIILLFGGWYL